VERGLQVQLLERELEALPVLVEQPSVCEVVSVLLDHLDLLEPCGLLEDSSVQDGVVESRVVGGSIGVFFG